jgi:hypothetical protein
VFKAQVKKTFVILAQNNKTQIFPLPFLFLRYSGPIQIVLSRNLIKGLGCSSGREFV